MKRAVIVSVRESVDKKTSENVVWTTLAQMPQKGKNGNVYYPMSNKILLVTSAGEVRSPDKFTKYKKFKIGDIVDVHMAINNNNDTVYVSDLELVKESTYKESDLIV